eukprot:TRINITY_DN40069_c0_g1_i1.p1 TRINITY_DN40069_c0_g1~~TRINITY_DN40069_c0_g1_i1.p1  ORF type:complete len:140 (-),score=24.73 TRINITY_DN40069_c0_g1_i1:157-576(-)
MACGHALRAIRTLRASSPSQCVDDVRPVPTFADPQEDRDVEIMNATNDTRQESKHDVDGHAPSSEMAPKLTLQYEGSSTMSTTRTFDGTNPSVAQSFFVDEGNDSSDWDDGEEDVDDDSDDDFQVPPRVYCQDLSHVGR